MENTQQKNEPVYLTPAQKTALLPGLTKQRILETVMDFVETSDLPSTIDNLTEVGESIANLNAMVESDEALNTQEIQGLVWTISRFTKLYINLYWLAKPVEVRG